MSSDRTLIAGPGPAGPERLPWGRALLAGAAAGGATWLFWRIDRSLGTSHTDPALLRRETLVFWLVGALASLLGLLTVLRPFPEGRVLRFRPDGAAALAVALVAGFVVVLWLPSRGILIGRRFRPFMAGCVSLFSLLDYLMLRDLLRSRNRARQALPGS